MLGALVLSVRREQLKIPRAVIRRHMVPVMHDLAREKVAPDHLLHHEPMLPNVPMPVGVRVVRRQHQPILPLVEPATALPSAVLLPSEASRNRPETASTSRPTLERARQSFLGGSTVELPTALRTRPVRPPVRLRLTHRTSIWHVPTAAKSVCRRV